MHRPCSANTNVVDTDIRGSNALGDAWSRIGAGAGRVRAAAAADTASAAATAALPRASRHGRRRPGNPTR